jgi:hypothetical protein
MSFSLYSVQLLAIGVFVLNHPVYYLLLNTTSICEFTMFVVYRFYMVTPAALH